ncbi:hypothetical protein ES708_13678 [subsurface metagenome]
MPFTIGSPPINRGAYFGMGYTQVLKENPSTARGKVVNVEIYVHTAMTNLTVATFTQVAPNTFTTRASALIPSAPTGYSKHDVDIAVDVGDFIGYHLQSGYFDRDNTGEGYWSLSGDWIPCSEKAFPFLALRTISLLGNCQLIVPGILNWAALDYHYCNTPFQVKLTFLTDLDVHLWCRWSTQEPRRHPKPVLRRGIKIMDDIRFCFTVFTDLEQEEEGDTVQHTFYLPVWPFDTTFWFYLYGTRQGSISPSTTAIFKAQRLNPFRWIIADAWNS